MCYIDLFNMKKTIVREVSTEHCFIFSEVSSLARGFPPDGLLTSELAKHDVELNPHVIEPDPFASDDCLNDTPFHQFSLNKIEEENTMNQGADELSSGLNGRLRPRKSNIPSPQSTKLVRKSDGKAGQDKVKRTNTVSKTPPNKTDDLATKSDSTFLCPYCDKHFASKQTLSKHVRRIHTASSKQDNFIACLFCSHYEAETIEIIRHMTGTHPEQYFACLNCHTRFSSSVELAEHKTKSCETKLPYRSRLRQKTSTGSLKDTHKDNFGESRVFSDGHGFNGVVISCELKPSQAGDGADIEDNITTNLILPPSKNLGGNTGIEKNAVIVLDDIQWNKRIPPNFSFHNTDADQILSRLGVVHRSPRTGECTKKDWKNLDESTQKFEKCFDTSFYSKVASNVQENLSKFLDGSFNFNPDPDSTIKTRKSKNSVVINTAEGFPILLASEQYSRNAFDRYMPRAIAPKHKWKWDNLENDKGPINPDQIKRDSHTNNCIISLVSSLDIWTQLCMKRKFEEKFGCPPLEKKTEKQTIISNELKEILESRELPTPSTQVMKLTKKPNEKATGSEFPSCLGLIPSTSTYELQPAVLSGEWVRPRCYVCCACGAQARDSRAFSAHVSSQHPNAQVQHYEIVGEQLLNADILKHLYVPPSQMCNRTRPPRGFRECTKCRKSVTLEDLHQHMLDCAGDTPAVRRKCRYRPFGVRRRRPRLPDNTIRKKIRKDIRSRRRPKALMRPRPIRTEVGDAETIRKMIADLPAKRHRVLVNPNNPSLRPRIKQRPKILMKMHTSEDRNKQKKRNDKESSQTRLGSPVNDGTSVMSDDDNKPLKAMVRRVASKKSAPRRTEPEKRKTTMLKRAKRPNRQVKKGVKDESDKDATKSGCSSKPLITENISIENSSDKIDINTEDFKGREQAGQGQGSSNNREGQRPGCSDQSANSQNRCAPAQNVPLKHSIARLTADSEKHDKSVQFHHLFLVQQECNNVNEHVQSGQQLLFENEAAVLTLDKPPLLYNTKASLDALQKSKLNKPRKGLNACIAMLKNKLVEPAAESVLPVGHVSVQCGDDEPLYIKPDTALQTPIGLGTDFKSTTKPDITHDSGVPHELGITHSVANDIKSSEYTKDKDLKTPSSSGETILIQHSVDHDKKRSEYTNDKTLKTRSISGETMEIQHAIEHDNKRLEFTKDKALKTPSISGETIEIQHAIEHDNKRSEYTKDKALKTPSISGETIEIQDAIEHDTKRSEYTQEKALKRPSTSGETIGIQHSVDHDKKRSQYAKNKSLKTPLISGETITIPHSVDHNKKKSEYTKEKGLKTRERMKSQKSQLIEVTHELGLRRSLVKEDKSIEISSQRQIITQTDVTNVMVPLEQIAPKTIPLTVNASAQKERKEEVKKSNIEGKKTKRRIKVKDTSKDIQYVKSNKSRNETPQLPTASAVANKSYDTLNRQTSEEKQIIPDHPRHNTINHTTTTNEEDQNVKEKGNNVYYGNCLGLQAQADYHSDCEYSRKVNMNNFPSPDFNHVPVNNRPAHASTHVESIVSVPLDLSGKVSNVNTTQDLLNHSYLLGAYDSYETLDLSNKNQDVGSNDEIVDLSIKTSYLKSIENDIIANDNVTDLSLKSCAGIDVPTDLTIKKKIVEILDVSERVSPQQREVISLDKPSKSQLEDEMGQFVSANVNQLDTKASDITPPVDSEDANLIRKVIKAKEVNTSTSKSENLLTIVPEKASEVIIESVPADLSCQQQIEDISKNLSAPTQVTTLKIEQDPYTNQENVSQMHSRTGDKISMQVQKPIYDPTLKIPQYKIRAASSHDNPSNGGVTPNTSSLINTTSSSSLPFTSNNSEITPNLTQTVSTVTSGAKHTIGIHDELPFAYGTVPLNAPHSNPGSVYGISNCGVTSHLNKFETTTPVYTLATACISVTKIETSNSTTLTNTLLSIPGNTIANTTPVYTLAGTTIVAPIGVQANYSHIVPAVTPNSEMKKAEERIMPGANIQSKAQHEKELSNHKERVVYANSMENVEHDPETARKIALLPKELVDVLGNMPVDHRNRLLNILPQYVSSPMADTGLKCDVPNQSESSLKLTTSETKGSQMPIVLESTQDAEPKVMAPLFKGQEEHKILQISNTNTQFDLENTPAMPPLAVNPTTLSLHRPINSDDSANTDASYTTQTHRNANTELNTEVKIKSDVISEDSFSALASNRLSSCHNLSSDKVIDLTEDETVCRSDIPNEPTVEIPPISLIVQPKRNKSNNDQTASLRAVRIKAPSERQKSVDSQLATYTSVAPVLPNIIHNNEQDNEVDKSLHINVSLNTDMSLAIQQAEVSSTQHSNKNVVAESKFPSVISPNVQESNLDETNNSSLRRLSTASKDESLKIEDSLITKSGVKTTLVSSSILNNKINKEPVQLNSKKCTMNTDVLDTKYISKDRDMATESHDLTVNNSTSLTDSNVQSRLDISESYDVPIQCSTPKPNMMTGKQPECLLTSTEDRLPTASEDQEDSEDDLSLAAICKQKQQNLLKADLTSVETKNNSDIVIRKKEKRNKKNVENIITARVPSLSNNNTVISMALSNDKQTDFVNKDGLPSKLSENEKPQITPTTGENVKKNNRKLRRKKMANNSQSNSCDMSPKDALTDCDTNNVTVKSKDVQIQITEIVKIGGSYNTVLKDDNKLSVSSSRKRFKINDDNVLTETIKEQSLEKTADALKFTPIVEKQKNKKKKSLIENTETDNCEIIRLASNLDHKNIDISTPPSNNNKNLLFDHGTSSSVRQIRCSDDIRFKDKSEIISDDRLNSKGTNNKEPTTSLGATVAVTSFSSLEETNNMTTPLRRSKRGRSRNNSLTGEESLHIETMQENRTPLTKKQLIFSKLLLDEENNIRNPDSATGEKIENLRKSSVKESVQDDIKEPESENIIPEKNKCVKRKKSPHLKRKCKKKKSLCTQSNCEEGVDGLQDQVKDVITQEDLNTSKDNEPSADKTINDACTSNLTHALTDVKCIHSDDKPLQVCIEKRKSNELLILELSHLPKKSKLNISECGSDTKTSQSDREEKNIPPEKDSLSANLNVCITDDAIDGTAHSEKNTGEKSNTITKTTPVSEKPTRLKLNQPDSRTKTCYNMPVAGRRTRSKSAVIKSAVYDPYDIDMDDMIEQAEPLRQRKISSDYKSSNNMKNSSKEVQNMTISKDDDKKISSQELGPTTPTLDSYSNHDMNDSDDSSKSDIPLKKYVEEKEKKICGFDESVSIQKKNVENKVEKNKKITNDKDKKLSTDKKNRRTLGVCNSSDGIAQDETEQQLRSEQFMASFGFFSERKPRKSNLLATKKISETFHIIANEPDDMYFSYKDRNSKKSAQNENRKSFERDTNLKGTRQRSPLSKKTTKRGRKKKNSTTIAAPTYCHICKKEFRRSDNFLRHQMTLLHVSKMSEVEMKVKTVPVLEEPNYLIAYKEHLDRLKIITDKIKRKKHSKSNPKIAPLSLEEILADVNKIVREQQLSHRGLSCDEELFLDCCELLKESHKKQEPIPDMPSLVKDPDILCSPEPTNVGLDLLGKTDVDVKRDNKSDGDVDSLTAKTILESEEVRNLENDLISGLKEAANASNLKKSGIIFQRTVSEVTSHQHDFNEQYSSPPAAESQYDQLNNYEEPAELNTIKSKKYPEFKEKMYPDIEEIDMFEDKFDKIKRKCRSQAAAAKQPQLIIEPSISRKGRKKSEKKKGKKNSKKNHPSTVLTKGALKGFDGIKVSIPTSDINMCAIVSPLETTRKKKKKGNSKKRRENKISESSSKYDSDHHLNENPASLKNVDVYEFMDNEDVELFEFRPSTLMERFKSISNKDIPSTSKANPVVEEPDKSSTSASDGDDFVYMSDDYVCSDDETENSLMSCDVSNSKIPAENKKLSSQMKKRDAIEKNAVMGKIFKNNAVRSEKKITKNKEPAKPKANLDQLFDSLLEDEPSSSMLNDESLPLKEETPCATKYGKRITSPSRSDELSSKYDQYHIKKKYNNLTTEKEDLSSKYKNVSSENDDDEDDDDEDDDDAEHAGASCIDYGPSTSKLCLKSFMGDHKSTKPDLRPSLSPPELKPLSPKKYDHTSSKQHVSYNKNEKKSFHLDDYFDFQGRNSKNTGTKRCDSKSVPRKIGDGAGTSGDYNDAGDPSLPSDETGVARQRARRKCTVGKQNILAETWSSESEPDGGPPRPNSAESMASGTTRKKKGKKKDSQHTGGRRTNNRHTSFKKQEIESRVTSSNRNTTTHTSGASSSTVVDNRSTNSALGSFTADRSEPSTSAVGTSGGSCKFVTEPPATPSTSSRASPTPSTSAGPSTSTGCATSDPEDGTFLVPAEPGSSSGSTRHRPLYYWSGKDGTEAQAREAQAREQVAREEQARQLRAREEQARQELLRREHERAEQARREHERAEQARREHERAEQARREHERAEQARREHERAEQARKEKEREQRARDEEAQQQQQQQQQHGWIVGDSHKKLVTMLAHAKGRKRNNNNDDKRHKTE